MDLIYNMDDLAIIAKEVYGLNRRVSKDIVLHNSLGVSFPEKERVGGINPNCRRFSQRDMDKFILLLGFVRFNKTKDIR